MPKREERKPARISIQSTAICPGDVHLVGKATVEWGILEVSFLHKLIKDKTAAQNFDDIADRADQLVLWRAREILAEIGIPEDFLKIIPWDLEKSSSSGDRNKQAILAIMVNKAEKEKDENNGADA